jgi:hypothetical protein
VPLLRGKEIARGRHSVVAKKVGLRSVLGRQDESLEGHAMTNKTFYMAVFVLLAAFWAWVIKQFWGQA